MTRAISVLLGLACLAAAAFAVYSATAGRQPPAPPGVYADEPTLIADKYKPIKDGCLPVKKEEEN